MVLVSFTLFTRKPINSSNIRNMIALLVCSLSYLYFFNLMLVNCVDFVCVKFHVDGIKINGVLLHVL